jgi:biotin transport system substrate-specific component
MLIDRIRVESFGRDAAAWLRDTALIGLGSVLVALSAKVQIPLAPVPLTCQDFAVLLVGATLGSRRGSAALVLYLVEGLLGIPVFAGPIAGPLYLLGPTGGYLLAFPLAAYAVGTLAESGWLRHLGWSAAALALASGVILATGFAWCVIQIGAASAFDVAIIPFLVWNPIKIAILAVVLTVGSTWQMGRSKGQAGSGD